MIRANIKGDWAFISASDEIKGDIDDFFAVEIPGIRHSPKHRKALRYGWDGKVHFFNKWSGKLPARLIPFLEDQYEIIISGGDCKTSLRRERKLKRLEKNLSLNGIELDKFQRKAILRAVLKRSGIIRVATNGGKTEIAIGIFNLLKSLIPDVKALYLVHRIELLHQVADRFKLRSGIKCGKIGSGLWIIKDVTVGMVQSLPKPIKKNREFYDQFDILIMDEAQHESAATWHKIAKFMPCKYRFALSGTPWTGDTIKDLKLISMFGRDLIADVRNRELIDKGWSATPHIHIWPMENQQNYMKWSSAYQFMIVDSTAYNEKIINITKESYEKGYPTLILVNRIPHGSRLYRRLLGEGIDCAYITSNAQSRYRKKIVKKFRDERLSVVIATPVFDEGVDFPAIRTLILAGGYKAPISLLQRIGRALRKKHSGPNRADIHDFFVFGNQHLEGHSLQRIGVYEEEGFDIRYHHKEKFDPAIMENSRKYFETGKIDWHRFHREESK